MTRQAVARRSFLKLGAGASAMALLNACAGTDEAAAPAQQSEAPTAASDAAAKDAQEVPWEMPQSQRPPISIDVHSHWSPAAYTQALRDVGRRGNGGAIQPLMDNLKNKIRWMDERAVQMVILTLSGRQPWYWLSPAEAARHAALVNDAGIEAHKAFPDRFVLGAEIPARDPELSVKELDRIAGKPGVKGLHLPPSMEFKDYVFEPAFEPVLARAEKLGLPLLFHPLDEEVNYWGGTQTRIGQPLTEDSFIYNTLGFPMDTATTAAMFIVTGTLDKYPNLQIVLPHAGGNFPYIAGRVEHGLTRRKFPLKRPFREYLRQFHYDTMTYYPETMRFLIEFAGVDRIMVGTDGGYERSALEPTQGIGRQRRAEWPNAMVEVMKLPKDQEEMILRGNAVKLFKLTTLQTT